MDDVLQVLLGVPKGLVIAFCANLIFFFVPTYLFHTLLYPLLSKRRIRYDKDPEHASVTIFNFPSIDPQLRLEFLNSIHVAVGGLIGIAVLSQLLVAGKIVQPLPVSSPTDWWLIARQFGIYFVTFDAYYYFLHRFFFHSSWGWKMHKVHHDSFVVTPTTGFSFHWFEGVITGGFNPFLAHLLRFDQKTVIICQLYGVMNTIFVHMGIQVCPTWWDQTWLTKWYLSSQFHDVHHQKVGCNYGGFTTIYDHIFGTVYHGYQDMVDKLAKRIHDNNHSNNDDKGNMTSHPQRVLRSATKKTK